MAKLFRKPYRSVITKKASATVTLADYSHARPQLKRSPMLSKKGSTITPNPEDPKPRKYTWNSLGLIQWDSWDGQLWNIQKLDCLRMIPDIKSAESSRFLLQQITSQLSIPIKELDGFMAAHHHSIVVAGRRTLPFQLHAVDTKVLQYLLRTSPRHISQRLHSDISKLVTLLFVLEKDVRDLASIHRDIAMFPHNPLYVISRVQKARWVAAAHEIRFARLRAQKEYRFTYKAARGLKWNTGENDLQKLVLKIGGPLPATTYPRPFFLRPYTWAIEPFIAGLSRTMALQRRLLSDIKVTLLTPPQHMKPLLQRHGRHSSKICDSLREQEFMVRNLTKELAALVYFRAWRYDVEHPEIRLGKTFYAQLAKKFGTEAFPTPPGQKEPSHGAVPKARRKTSPKPRSTPTPVGERKKTRPQQKSPATASQNSQPHRASTISEHHRKALQTYPARLQRRLSKL